MLASRRDFEPEKLGELVRSLPAVVDSTEADVLAFAGFLAEAANPPDDD
jgi:hypothetical protein